MIAGAICESSECNGLIAIILIALLAFAVIVVSVAALWALAIAAFLERRGLSRAARWLAALMSTGLLAAVCSMSSSTDTEVGQGVTMLVAVGAVPAYVSQRVVTRRFRRRATAQSSPCSTA